MENTAIPIPHRGDKVQLKTCKYVTGKVVVRTSKRWDEPELFVKLDNLVSINGERPQRYIRLCEFDWETI